MIRLIVNLGSSLCCFLIIFSICSTGITGGHIGDCGSQNFSEPFNVTNHEGCDKFFTCFPTPNDTLKANLTIGHCDEGFRYSAELARCEVYKKVNCSGRDYDPRPILKSELCRLEDGKFLCKSGKQCISSELLCNKDFDCLDASDEFEHCDSVCGPKHCAHSCAATPPTTPDDLSTAGTCICRPGYTVSSKSPNRCEDVDECRNFTTCSQLCKNKEGSFECSCVDGFKVGRNESSCEPEDAKWKLIYTTRTQVEYIVQDGSENAGKYQLSTNPGLPIAVTYDARGGIVYWTDVSSNVEKIYRKSLDDGPEATTEIIVDAGVILPEGIALDWITGNIYFTDSNLSHIAVCGNTSNLCSVLIQEVLDKPRDIALHPNQGIMLWTDWGTNPAIMRAGMDGSHPLPIIQSELKWPNGITIDVGNGRFYWVDANLDRIETALLDGEDRQLIFSVRSSHPFGVDIFGDKIFWSDWINFSVKSANKMTGLQRKIHVHEPNSAMNGLAVYHIANQPINRSNPCQNSRCSHICTLTPTETFKCICPVGMILDHDRRSCIEPESLEKLVVAFKNTIKMMRFNSIGKEVWESISFPELKTIRAVVYNPVNNSIIISDSSHKKIYEYSISRKKLTILINEHLDAVEGIDIDPVSENLYWVDAGRQTVEVMSFRTSARKVLMNGVDNPYGILVLPHLGSLFLARQGRRGGKIYKMLMNGYSNSVFQRLGEKEPVGLAYDREMDSILWADKVNRAVESISTDGKYTSVLISQKTGPPTDVVKHGNQVYWTDMFAQNLKSMSVGTVDVRSTKIGSFDNSSAPNNHTNFFPKMTIINKDLSYLDVLREKHECSWKNPDRKLCSHVCVMDGLGFTGACVCPEGFTLQNDGVTCSVVSTCSPEQFMCKDGHCISSLFVCDGTPDCSNHDDEVNCKPKECPVDHFKCEANDVCIPAHWVCDGENDCLDGMDERNCTFAPCNHDFDFRCESGRCIPKSWRCDHAFDCPGDDSDERGCDFECPHGFFQCTTSQNCIVADWVCDKERDCEDGSDELQDCNHACNETEFTCNSGKCIDIALVCDGSANCANNEDEAHCDFRDEESDRIIVTPIEQLSNEESHGTAVAIVLGVLIIIILVAVIIAMILHHRNIRPKILIRPYVQNWNKYVNEPARRMFSNRGGRPEKLDCEMNEYDDVYTSGSATYYNTHVYEEIDGHADFVSGSPNGSDDRKKDKDAVARSFADSGILASERESLYDEAEDCGNHYVSYNQKDKLISN